MPEIYYVHPGLATMSFSKISKAHIHELRGKVKIQEMEEKALDNLQWLDKRNILLHPILYTTIGDKPELFQIKQKRLYRLLSVKRVLGGFETADSDRMSEVAIDTINKLDVVFLPSRFAVDTFRKSGAKVPLELLSHGLSAVMLTTSKEITSPQIKNLLNLKVANNATFCLYFCQHSDYRKGADIVFEAFRILHSMFKDLYLVKKGQANDQYIAKLRTLRTIEIPAWFSEEELRQLYDICDMLIVPSRGGGFELNALEGIARGLPTIVPDAGCFRDYIHHCVPLPIVRRPRVFPDHTIHVGKGWEISSDDLARTIASVKTYPDKFKAKAEAAGTKVRDTYSWNVIGQKLYELLRTYGFCEC